MSSRSRSRSRTRSLDAGFSIVGGYLAALLGPSFYLRRRIGARRWRRLHRLTVLVWLFSVAHAVGAGTDARRLWIELMVLAPAVPIAYLMVLRGLNANRSDGRRGATRPVSPRTSEADGVGSSWQARAAESRCVAAEHARP